MAPLRLPEYYQLVLPILLNYGRVGASLHPSFSTALPSVGNDGKVAEFWNHGCRFTKKTLGVALCDVVESSR
jgi:hypothetical protein